MVQGSHAVRPQEQTPPHGRLARGPDTAPSLGEVSTAETGVRPGAAGPAVALGGGTPPARQLQVPGRGGGHSEVGT